MITSGPRSYYDEYVRKRDTERAFAKPPALLTDRNAYINFLEVQLERVSSACFSVQSYEERFNDMQGLIVALDERCASTSKLLALAQQCTEEVRAEAQQRIELESQANKSMRSEVFKNVQALSNTVGQLERAVAAVPRLEAKATAMEKRVNELEETQSNALLDLRASIHSTNERISRLESVKDELFALIESNRAAISRVSFDVEENNTRVSSYINTVETRIQQSLDTAKDGMDHQVAALQARTGNQLDEIRRLVETKDLEMLNRTKKQYKALSEEIEGCRRSWVKDCDALAAHLREDSDRKISQLQHSLSQTTSELRAAQSKQADFMCDLEETFSAQLDALQSDVQNVSTAQRSQHVTFADTHKALEGKVEELRTSLQSPARTSSMTAGYSWMAPPAYTQQQQQHQAGPVSMSGAYGGDGHPPSPVRQSADGSFFFAPTEASFAGASAAPAHFAAPPNPLYPPAPHTDHTGRLGGLPVPLGVPQRAASPTHSRHRRQGSGDVSVLDTARSTLRSEYRSTAAGEGGEESTAPSRKSTRSRRQDPEVSAVDIVQKFLQIYETDQKEIAKRLDQLGAAKSTRSNSAIRRRLRTATAAVRKQQQQSLQAPASQSVHKREGAPSRSTSPTQARTSPLREKRAVAAGTEKTPGEVLSRFFLNYRKDRKALLDRMSSLEAAKSSAAAQADDQERTGDAASEEKDEGYDPLSPARSALSANSAAFWKHRQENEGRSQPIGETQAPASVTEEGDDDQEQRERDNNSVNSAASSDPAGEAMAALLSRSMDDFMRTYRHRSAKGRTQRSPGRSAGSSMGDSRTSPQRFSRSASLLGESAALSRTERTKRYQQPTESLCISRSQSPVLNRAAMDWIHEPATNRPVWKVNTYRSPDRLRKSADLPGSRSTSISPGARTAASLIDRLVRQDHSAIFSTVQGASKCGDGGVEGVVHPGSLKQAVTTTHSAPAPAGNSAAGEDAASVASTSESSQTTKSTTTVK